MTATYLAGYDGTDAARAAITFAKRLAATRGAVVTAATVYHPVPHVYSPGASRAADLELTEELVGEARRVQASIDVDGVRTVVVPGRSPAHGLHDLAVRENASLLAVGATHRGALGRLVPGSVGERLLHGSPCPVAVVPADWADVPVRALAVAYDGSPESKGALRTAEELAARLGARVVILTAYDPAAVYVPGSAGIYAAGMGDEIRQRLADEARHAADAVRADVPAEWRLLQGPPARVLLDAAEEAADLLVMGSRAYGPVRTVLLGSVARQAIDHADVPVIVVPRGAAVEGATRAPSLAAAEA